MVEIKLISFDNGIAVIDCYPEGKQEQVFQLKIDVKNKKVLHNPLKFKGSAYAIHAAWKMYDIYDETGTLPQSAVSIWY